MEAWVEFGLSKLPAGIDARLITDPAVAEQGYKRVKKGDKVFEIHASDDSGFMYGLLDLAEDVRVRGADKVEDYAVSPYLRQRGIKFNIPLDARTPSYSDSTDSAIRNIENMWDFSFWTHFLDRMAEEKMNLLSLWSLNPFPSMVVIPEYPEASLDDVMAGKQPKAGQLSGYGLYDTERELVVVKKMTIAEKIEFWKKVMAYAKSRCVKIMIVTWNIFTYGTEKQDGGIAADQLNEKTADYFRAGTRALINTYPDLAGIGITSGENMWMDETDIPFLAKSYGQGIKDALADKPERDFRFIHRMQMAHYQEIIDNFSDLPCPLEISFKYSQAHMLSSDKPHFIDGFLKQKKEGLKVWLTVRNDDFYMMRWGDPEYMRSYIANMPAETLEGVYLGADGYTWGRVYIDKKDSSNPLFFDKMWYFFSMWGKLTYDINTPDDRFCLEGKSRFALSDEEAKALYSAWASASRPVPAQQCVHWHDFDFQWYPEGSCLYLPQFHELRFANINEFVQGHAIPRDRFVSIEEYCKGRITSKQNPHDIALKMIEDAEKALSDAGKLQTAGKSAEYEATVRDIVSMSYLGLYYAHKILAAIGLYRMRYQGKSSEKTESIRNMEKAAEYWKKYSARIDEDYRPQFLCRLCHTVDIRSFDKLVDEDVEIIRREC